MHCFCFKKLIATGYEVRKISFTEFQVMDEATQTPKEDETLYCEDWFFNYGFQQSAIVGTSLVVVGINVIASIVLTLSVGIEKSHTVNDETMGQFQKLTILQFINIAVIILIINIDLTSSSDVVDKDDSEPPLFLGFLPIFNGQFDDFDSAWFAQVGKTLTLTLLINIFTPHVSKLSLPFLKLLKRCLDRGCSQRIWKPKDGKDGSDVNTKLLIQSDLNLLYTGDQIQSHYVYAQNFTYMCVVLMYSSGMPILYPFAAVFYCVLYWVYKGLLLKYYGKTTKFNQEIPINSMWWVKFGIIMHIMIGSIMLSNKDFFPKTADDPEDQEHVIDQFVPADFFLVEYVHRLQAGSQSVIYLAFMSVLLALWIGFNVLGLVLNFCSCAVKPIQKLIKCLFCCKTKKQIGIECKDILKEFNALSLENMLRKARDDLDDFT